MICLYILNNSTTDTYADNTTLSVTFVWKQQAYQYALTRQISHHKLLSLIQGLIIDKNLSFEAHIDELYKKLSKQLRLLRLYPYLKNSQKLIFYLSLIKPVMLYLSLIC